MKTAIIVKKGVKQIIFTPESEGEEWILKTFTGEENFSEIKKGPFSNKLYISSEKSIMLVFTPKKEENE